MAVLYLYFIAIAIILSRSTSSLLLFLNSTLFHIFSLNIVATMNRKMKRKKNWLNKIKLKNDSTEKKMKRKEENEMKISDNLFTRKTIKFSKMKIFVLLGVYFKDRKCYFFYTFHLRCYHMCFFVLFFLINKYLLNE